MKVILYMAMTVNGMVARENDETPWSSKEWKMYATEVKKHKALIIGRRTYDLMKKDNSFKKLGNPYTVIVTSSNVMNQDKFVFVDSPKKALEEIKKKNFKCVIVGGGSGLNSSFLKEKLINEIILDVEPLILGTGIKLFDGELETKLKLLNVKKFSPNEIQLHYKILK